MSITEGSLALKIGDKPDDFKRPNLKRPRPYFYDVERAISGSARIAAFLEKYHFEEIVEEEAEDINMSLFSPFERSTHGVKMSLLDNYREIGKLLLSSIVEYLSNERMPYVRAYRRWREINDEIKKIDRAIIMTKSGDLPTGKVDLEKVCRDFGYKYNPNQKIE